MSKRFGRNQKRNMERAHRAELLQLTALYGQAEARQSAIINELRRRLEKAIVFDVDAIAGWHDNTIQLRTKMMTIGRDDCNLALEISQREIELSGDRDRFLDKVGQCITNQLFDTLSRKGWPVQHRGS